MVAYTIGLGLFRFLDDLSRHHLPALIWGNGSFGLRLRNLWDSSLLQLASIPLEVVFGLTLAPGAISLLSIVSKVFKFGSRIINCSLHGALSLPLFLVINFLRENSNLGLIILFHLLKVLGKSGWRLP